MRAKILYVIGSLDIGGAEVQLTHLVSRLDLCRFEPTVCCLTHEGMLSKDLRLRGVRIHSLGLHRCGVYARDILRVLRAFTGLTQLLKTERPVIIHAYMFHAHILAAFAARAARAPCLINGLHNTGKFLPGFAARILEGAANRLTDITLACSNVVAESARRRMHIPPERLRIIHNGVEIPPILDSSERKVGREALGLKTAEPTLICVANFHAYKGHSHLLRALHSVREAEPRVQLLLLGDGPLAKALEVLASKYSLTDCIHFLGHRRDVTRMLQLADIFVLASEREAFPVCILESMAAGRPVVATEVGGIPEAVVHGETGLLVPPGDSGALAEAILTLLRDPARAQAMGWAGRDRAIKAFGLDRMVTETQQLYDELLAMKRTQWK